jgi:hypothetical protein
MKKIAAPVIILSLVTLMGCDIFRKWETYESKEGWFRVLFKGSPKIERNSMYSPFGLIKAHTFSVELRSGAYAVSYFDLPEEVEKSQEPVELLDNMARGSFAQLGTGNFTKKDIELDGYQGLEAEGKIRKGSLQGIDRIRYYLVDGRVFMLQVLGETSFVASDNTNKFFDSFQLLPEE